MPITAKLNVYDGSQFISSEVFEDVSLSEIAAVQAEANQTHRTELIIGSAAIHEDIDPAVGEEKQPNVRIDDQPDWMIFDLSQEVDLQAKKLCLGMLEDFGTKEYQDSDQFSFPSPTRVSYETTTINPIPDPDQYYNVPENYTLVRDAVNGLLSLTKDNGTEVLRVDLNADELLSDLALITEDDVNNLYRLASIQHATNLKANQLASTIAIELGTHTEHGGPEPDGTSFNCDIQGYKLFRSVGEPGSYTFIEALDGRSGPILESLDGYIQGHVKNADIQMLSSIYQSIPPLVQWKRYASPFDPEQPSVLTSIRTVQAALADNQSEADILNMLRHGDPSVAQLMKQERGGEAYLYIEAAMEAASAAQALEKAQHNSQISNPLQERIASQKQDGVVQIINDVQAQISQLKPKGLFQAIAHRLNPPQLDSSSPEYFQAQQARTVAEALIDEHGNEKFKNLNLDNGDEVSIVVQTTYNTDQVNSLATDDPATTSPGYTISANGHRDVSRIRTVLTIKANDGRGEILRYNYQTQTYRETQSPLTAVDIQRLTQAKRQQEALNEWALKVVQQVISLHGQYDLPPVEAHQDGFETDDYLFMTTKADGEEYTDVLRIKDGRWDEAILEYISIPSPGFDTPGEITTRGKVTQKT